MTPTVTIAANWVALLLTLLIPVAVAIITKAALPAKFKTVVTMVLAAAVVLIRRSQVDGGAAIISTQVAYDWAVTTAIAVASYLGFWAHLDVNGKAAPGFGLGK